MSSKEFLQVKAAIYEMGLLFNQQPSDERITAYANALKNYEPNQIIFAFNKVINSGTAFFPSLAEILKHLRPQKEVAQDKAPQVANEMLQALRTFGPHAEDKMLLEVSPEARATFKALGYTGDIRNSDNIDTVRAQLERLARGVINSTETKNKNSELEKIGIKEPGKVLSMNKPGMKTLDFSDFQPEGA